MKAKKLGVFVSSLTVAFTLIGCGTVSHTHNYVLVPEVAANCADTGTEAYYTCSGCSDIFDMQHQKIEAPVVIPKDPSNHKGTKTLALDNGYTTSYKVGDTFDLNSATLRWKCEHCTGTTLTATEKSAITITYPTQSATAFTADDVTRGACTVTLTLNTYHADATVTVGKKDNAITGLVAQTGHCGLTVADLQAKFTLAATSGEDVDLLISDTQDGTYTKLSERTEPFNVRTDEETSVWYLKAESAATPSYVKAETGPVTLTITHNELVWDTSRSDYDFVGCLCRPDDVLKFMKAPTNTTEMLLTNETVALDLTGTSYDSTEPTHSIKSIKMALPEGDPLDLGTNVTAVPTASIKTAGVYGAAEIQVTVTTAAAEGIPACDHLIKVPLNVITAKIATENDWKNNLVPAAKGQTIKGYFVLTADISCSTVPAWISGWDTAIFSGIIDGDGHKVTLGEGSYGQFYVLDKATIKNTSFYCNWYRRAQNNYCLLANKCLSTTFDNVKFLKPAVATGQETTEYIAGANDGYLFNNGGFQACTFNKCDFNFEGIQVPVLFCHSNNNTDSHTFTDCTMKCAGVGELFSTANGSITTQDGLVITVEKEIILDQDPVEALMTSSDPVAITLPEEYSEYTVQSIKLGDNNLGTDLTNVAIPQTVKENTQAHGNTRFSVTVKKDTTTVKLGVPALFITQEITTVAEVSALTHQDGSQKNVYGYYRLKNDLNFNEGYTEFASSNWNWFCGTFDGNGKTITSKSRPCGLFGGLDGATLKNFTITDGWSYGGIDSNNPVLAQDAKGGTVIENVNVVMSGKANRTLKDKTVMTGNVQNFGWIIGRVCYNVTFKNCLFDGGTTLDIQVLAGCHGSVAVTFADCTMKCKDYYCITYKNGTVETAPEGLTITGNCVYVAE